MFDIVAFKTTFFVKKKNAFRLPVFKSDLHLLFALYAYLLDIYAQGGEHENQGRHYENTPIPICRKFHLQKLKNFR